MGLDLRIMPAYSGNSDFSLTSLECHRDYAFFDFVKDIQKTHGRDVPRNGFSGYMGDEWKKSDEDAYGDVLQSVQAKDLAGIDEFDDNATNRAIAAYIQHLEPEHECFLYWH